MPPGTLPYPLAGSLDIGFITSQEVPSPMSATVREAAPDTPFAGGQVLRINGSSGASVQTYVDEDIPADVGAAASILKAHLRLYKAAPFPIGAQSITVSRITEDWDASTVTFNNAPAVGEQTTGAAAGEGDAGDLVELDVTELVQAAQADRDAGTGDFYGFRLETTSTTDLTFYSAYAGVPDYIPALVLEVSYPPLAPEDLLPNGGRAVSETQPLLDARFIDPDADDTISAIEVEIDTDDTFETPTYDSGEIPHTSASFDLADPPAGAPATPTLSTATTYYWRMRVADNHGVWSEWSETASFQVIAKGTLSLTSPASDTVSSPTPTFAWTFTPAGAETQESISLELERFEDGLWRDFYFLRRNISAATSVTLPDAYALEEGVEYRVTIRVWDTVDRESMATDRDFLEDSQEFEVETVSV